MIWFGYSLSYLGPLLTYLSSFGGNLYYALVLMIALVLIPLLDSLIGDDGYNPSSEEEAELKKKLSYSWLLYGFVPVQCVLLLWACQTVSVPDFDLLEWGLLLFLVGLVNGGLSINTAHELCHRNTRFDQNMAKLLWFRVNYMHFHIEHKLGHHIRMCTPEDPATARLGESVYAFYFRSVVGSFTNAWQIEMGRLQRKGAKWYSWRNQMLWFIGLPFLFTVLLYAVWGWQASLFYLLQSGLAVFTLETINYLEHYGLERKRLGSGKYEKVGIQHSWNSSRQLTNYFLFKLQRHSDHHVNPHRKYQLLRAFPEGPQLPTGYGGMFLLALCPPLWRRVMDPRAKACREAQETIPCE